MHLLEGRDRRAELQEAHLEREQDLGQEARRRRRERDRLYDSFNVEANLNHRLCIVNPTTLAGGTDGERYYLSTHSPAPPACSASLFCLIVAASLLIPNSASSLLISEKDTLT